MALLQNTSRGPTTAAATRPISQFCPYLHEVLPAHEGEALVLCHLHLLSIWRSQDGLSICL
eukprot:4457259-Lingulodinium_polyedra.AAC.1